MRVSYHVFGAWCYCQLSLVRGGCLIMLFGVWCYCQRSLIRGGCLIMVLASGVISYDYSLEEGVL